MTPEEQRIAIASAIYYLWPTRNKNVYTKKAWKSLTGKDPTFIDQKPFKVKKYGIDRDSKDDDCGHLNKVSPLPSKDTKKEGEHD